MKKALDFVLSIEFWRMGLLWTFSLLISYWNFFFAQTTSTSSPPSFESRPVCVITGATSGLGAAAAHALSRHGFFVVLVGRSFQLLEKTMMDMKSQNIQVDKETLSGKFFGRLKQYPYAHVYECSKLFLLLFSYELHRQLSVMDISRQVSVMAVDPGVVKTNIMREVPPCLSNLVFVVLRLFCLLQSPEVGVSSILDAALAPPETSGVYFFGGKGRTVSSSMLSYDAKLAKELWNTSSDLFLESQLAFKETSSSVSNCVS